MKQSTSPTRACWHGKLSLTWISQSECALAANGAQLLLVMAGAQAFPNNEYLTAGAEGLLVKHRTTAVDGAQALPSTTAAAAGGHWPLATAGCKMCQMTVHITEQLQTAVI